MTATDGWSLALAGLLVVAAALAAAADAALSRVSRVTAQELVKEQRRGADRLLALVSDPARALNTALFVRVVCEVTATVLVARVALDLVEPPGLALLVAAAAMVAVAFVVVGVAPRTLGRQHAVRVALVAAGPVAALATVLGPLTRLLILLGNAITPGRGFREGPFASEAELRELVDLAERDRVIEDDERQMIHSVFELGDTLAREVMVPRTDLLVVGREVSLRRAISLSLRSGFSRIPVVGENIDDIVGFVYLKDLVRRVNDVRAAETTERVEQVMRPAAFVPDSKPVDELLREMQAQRIHAVVVVDEYGGTAGLVTIEDILEEIVGEITDEYDTGSPEVEELPDGTARVSARMNAWDFVERFGLDLDEDDLEDVDTVGGLLQASLGRVPIAGSVARLGGVELVAESLAGRRNRISSVRVRPVEEPAGTTEAAVVPPSSDEQPA